MRCGGCAEHRRLVLRTGASRWAPPAEPSMYMSSALVPGMFHVKPRRFAEESLSSRFGRRTSRQYMREFILACDDGMLRCPPGEVSLVPERRIRREGPTQAPTRRTEVGHAPDCMCRESMLGTEPCSRWLDSSTWIVIAPPPHRCMMLTARRA